MKYRLLGKSGLRVSEASLGTMTFGDEWGWGSPKAEAARASEAEKWRYLTVSTVFEDKLFDSGLYTANRGINS